MHSDTDATPAIPVNLSIILAVAYVIAAVALIVGSVALSEGGSTSSEVIEGGSNAFGVPYRFSAATTAADPGPGFLRFDTNPEAAPPTECYVSEVDDNGNQVTGILDQLTASTSPNRSFVVLFKQGDESTNLQFYVTTQVDNGSWRTLTISYIARSNWATVVDGDAMFMSISLTGDAGAPGTSTWKMRVIAATTAPGTLATSFAAGEIVDGVTLATNDRLLIKDQTDPVENGLYVVQSSGAPIRTADLPAFSDASSVSVFVNQGSANANSLWVCTSLAGSADVGTDPVTFAAFQATPAGGLNSELQYNNAGSFGGVSSWTTNGTTQLNMSDTGSLNFGSASDVNVTFNNGAGDLRIHNTLASGDIVVQLGSDDASSELRVETSSGQPVFSAASSGVVTINGPNRSGAPETTGSVVAIESQVFTDNTTGPGGTAPYKAFSSVAQPTLSAFNAGVTTTDAATLRIDGAPTAGPNQTITNAYGLHVANGNAKIGGSVFATSFFTVSDQNLKKNIKPLVGSREMINSIDVFTYCWKDPSRSSNVQHGVMAQQLEASNLSYFVEDIGTNKTVNYTNLIAVLIGNVKQLNQEIVDLKLQVDNLRAQLP
jgi:hypothetical protein